MASLLSGLLSSRGKPVILNGKLLMHGRQMVFAKESSNYSAVFTATSRNNKSSDGEEINLTTGKGLNVGEGEDVEEKLVNERTVARYLLDFDRKYAPAWGRTQESISINKIEKSVDQYTGAIVLESELYHKMMDPHEFHRIDREYNETAQRIRVELLLDYISNYYDIYTYLFNRRLMATYMPSFVKGHLVAGLFQPVVCSTELIRSPLEYPAVANFMSLLNGDSGSIYDGNGNIEVRLEPSESSSRGLSLTCVSTYDFANRFKPVNDDGSPAPFYVPKQLDKRVFMFMLMYLLSGIVNKGYDLPVPLETGHVGRMQELRENDEYRTFLNNIIRGYAALSAQIVTR